MQEFTPSRPISCTNADQKLANVAFTQPLCDEKPNQKLVLQMISSRGQLFVLQPIAMLSTLPCARNVAKIQFRAYFGHDWHVELHQG